MNPHLASLVLGLAQQAESALAGNLPPGAEALGAERPSARRDRADADRHAGHDRGQRYAGHLEPEEQQAPDPGAYFAAVPLRADRRTPEVPRRAAIIVLDGLGMGPAHDTAAYGDQGSDTLGNTPASRPRNRSAQSGPPRPGAVRSLPAWRR